MVFIRHGGHQLIKAGEEFNTDKGDPVNKEYEHVLVEPEVKSNQQVPTMTNTIGDKSNIVMQETLKDKTQCGPTQPDAQPLQVRKAGRHMLCLVTN